MGIIWAIIIGFFVGLIARILMPGRDAMGFILTTLLGIGGAVVGQLAGEVLGFYHEGQPAGFLMSLVGAMILLFLFNRFRPKTPVP